MQILEGRLKQLVLWISSVELVCKNKKVTLFAPKGDGFLLNYCRSIVETNKWDKKFIFERR
jgi:hypothetical protein